MNKVLFIVGPTATGKTALAFALAKKFNGELVSADSRQVFRGMDIGTGKDIQNLTLHASSLKHPNGKEFLSYYKNKFGTKLWLTDVVTPNQPFSVSQYLALAWIVIADIWSRGKLPIVVGGTGLYIKGLTSGIPTSSVKPCPPLRFVLKRLSTTTLQRLLHILSPTNYRALNYSDRHNPRRLVRHIELTLLAKFYPPSLPRHNSTLTIGIDMSNTKLKQAIAKRIGQRLADGLLDEIRSLLQTYRWSDFGLNTIAYKEFKNYMAGKETVQHSLDTWLGNEYHYAKRQKTWFRHHQAIHWLAKDAKLVQSADALVKKWYTKKTNA